MRKKMLDIVRRMLGVQSPSKIVRAENEKIGKWIKEGFEKGLEEGASNLLIIGIDLANEKDFTSPPSNTF